MRCRIEWRRAIMETDDITPGQRRLSLLAINLCVLGVGIGIGALVPLMALNLERRGVDASVIGLNAAMFPLAVLMVGPLLPRFLGRFGTVRSLYIGLGVTALSALLLPLLPSLAAWFVLRFVGGAAASIQWVISETWLNMVATERDRGRVMGLYAAVLAGGFAVGPVVIGLVGIEGWLPFLLVAIAVALAAVPVVFAAGLAPRMPAHQGMPLAAILRAQPLVLVSGLGGGLMDFALFAFLPIYGIGHGMVEASAVFMLSIFIGGNVLLQIPIGWLADRFGRPNLLLLVILTTLAGAVLLPFAVASTWTLYPLLFVWGGTTFAIYTLGLGLLGDGFPRAQLAAANVALVMVYEIGSAIGPTLSGSAIDLFGVEGLVGVVALSAAALLGAFFVVGSRGTGPRG
jgi:MFS family permease